MYIAVVSRKLHQDGRMRADHGLPRSRGGRGWLDEKHERAKSGRAGATKTDCEEGASEERRGWSQQQREIDAAERGRTWRGQSVKGGSANEGRRRRPGVMRTQSKRSDAHDEGCNRPGNEYLR